jgi:hypothetical protein
MTCCLFVVICLWFRLNTKEKNSVYCISLLNLQHVMIEKNEVAETSEGISSFKVSGKEKQVSLQRITRMLGSSLNE